MLISLILLLLMIVRHSVQKIGLETSTVMTRHVCYANISGMIVRLFSILETVTIQLLLQLIPNGAILIVQNDYIGDKICDWEKV
eukprot:UN01225